MLKKDDWQAALQIAEDRVPSKSDVMCRADDLKGVLHQLADQIADADRRHSAAFQEMHQRLAKLGGQTETIKATLPRHLASAFERIEDGISQLAHSLAETDRERQAHAAGEPLPLAAEVRASAMPEMLPTASPEPVAIAPEMAIASGHALQTQFIDEANLVARGAAHATVAAVEAPPPLKSAIGQQPPGTWGHKEPLKDLEPVFVQNPDDPWDQNSAAALTKLYESGEPGLPPPIPMTVMNLVPAAPANPLPTAAVTGSQAQLETSGGAPDNDAQQRAWLDSKLSDIAARVERSLLGMKPDSSFAALGERFDHF